VVISNCVVNLSPDKAAVFREVARVLKPGGRVAISDVVLTAELPPHVKGNLALYSACASGAASITELTAWMRSAGLTDVRVEPKDASRELIKTWAPGASLERYIVSANITARK
jgi:SAM-dependent methyltransferase